MNGDWRAGHPREGPLWQATQRLRDAGQGLRLDNITHAPGVGGPEHRSLPTAGPFHLEATVRLLQRRPTNRVDTWVGSGYRRAYATTEGVWLVETRNFGSIDVPDVRFAILNGAPSPATVAIVAASLRRTLGLDVDPAAMQRWAERKRGLRSTALALRGFRPPRFPSLFETFGSVIPFQQLSLDAGVSIMGRLVDRFGASVDVGGTRWFAFPEPEVVAEADLEMLRSVGLSRQKAETLRRLAARIASGDLREETFAALPTRAALAALTEEPGIGPWTAAVILLRGFGRTEVFPPQDTGAARGLGALLSLPRGPLSAAVIDGFGEHRGYLYFYSLGAQLLGRGLIAPAPRVRSNRRPPQGRREP